MKQIFTLANLLAPFFCLATVWQVGPGRTYQTPSSVAALAQPGDTVEIDAAIYSGDVCVWNQNNLLLKGVNGRPHLKANGNNAAGKGIWVLAGNNITVENIEFSEASVPDENGAGIRLDGTGMTVKNCYFHNNENGILTANNGGVVRLLNSTFSFNGFGDGQSHNIYIGHIDSAIIQYCYFHHANVGHELKSRARVNHILYNRLSNEATGNASREIDLPSGGVAVIVGNIIQQGPNSQNSNIIGYGLEGLVNTAPHELYLINNTIVNDRFAGSFVAANNSTAFIKMYNNIMAGPGTALLFGGAANVVDSVANMQFATVANAGFVDAATYDYHLINTAAAINNGANAGSTNSGTPLLAILEYVHPAAFTTRILTAAIDAGAFEFASILPVKIEHFTALPSVKNIRVNWVTSNELNIKHYELLRSSNGADFNKRALIYAQSASANLYSYTDTLQTPGRYIYKLKILDNYGQQKFSEAVSAVITLPENSSLPVGHISQLYLYLSNIPAVFTNTPATILLYNMSGALLFKHRLTIPASGTVSLPVSALQSRQQLLAVIDNEKHRLTIKLQPK